MFSASPRKLPYPLDRAINIQSIVDNDDEPCGLPAFPEDLNEKIPVTFMLSLNEFVALATAVDVGSDIAYGEDGIAVWYLWVASVMCASFCEQVAECVDNDISVQQALINQIQNNPSFWMAIVDAISATGTAVVGQPITETEAQSDITPDVIHTGTGCDLDMSWGASLFLVQSANRTITDFFEAMETLTNIPERLEKLVGLIPAIGNTLENIVGFANELYDDLRENYAAAYTEAYEEQLACEIFCIIRADCSLTVDDIIDVLSARLAIDTPTVFASVITFIGTGTFAGQPVVDAMMWLYFNALKFGQAFGAQVAGALGIRPLTQLMGLGADTLASDNWQTLCECPVLCNSYDFRLDAYASDWQIRQNTPPEDMSVYVGGVGYAPREQVGGNWENQIFTTDNFGCSTLEYTYTCPNVPTQVSLFWCNAGFTVLSLAANLTAASGTVTDTLDLSALTPPSGATGFLLVSGNISDGDYVVTWQQANFS